MQGVLRGHPSACRATNGSLRSTQHAKQHLQGEGRARLCLVLGVPARRAQLVGPVRELALAAIAADPCRPPVAAQLRLQCKVLSSSASPMTHACHMLCWQLHTAPLLAGRQT
jgi:hypothetical protein